MLFCRYVLSILRIDNICLGDGVPRMVILASKHLIHGKFLFFKMVHFCCVEFIYQVDFLRSITARSLVVFETALGLAVKWVGKGCNYLFLFLGCMIFRRLVCTGCIGTKTTRQRYTV